MPKPKTVSNLRCVEWECGCVFREPRGIEGAGSLYTCQHHRKGVSESERNYIRERSEAMLDCKKEG